MKVEKIIWQKNKKAFRIVYKCPKCGYSYESTKQDKSLYHEDKMPTMECPRCKNKI